MRVHGLKTATALLAALLVTACTVQPLYAPPPAPGASAQAPLSSIFIEPVNDRVGLVLRNHLIFLLNGGKGQPTDPVYTANLTVTSTTRSAFVTQVAGRDGEPTSQTVTVTAKYGLRKTADNDLVASRQATASASFDVSLQEFANVRALRDAENRAAKEAAEQLRGLLAADLSRVR